MSLVTTMLSSVSGAGAQTFTSLTVSGTSDLGNLRISSNTISSTNAGGDIILTPSTTGQVEIGANATKASRLRLREDTDNGTNYITLGAPSALAGNTDYNLPDAYPAVTGYVLSCTDAGVMSWAAVSSAAAATQAEQETGTDVTVFVSPGRQQFHASASKAWVRWYHNSGTPTAYASYNVTSLTDNNPGDVTINFTTSFSSATAYSYSAVGAADAGATSPFIHCIYTTGGGGANPTAGALRTITITPALAGTDVAVSGGVGVSCFGDL